MKWKKKRFNKNFYSNNNLKKVIERKKQGVFGALSKDGKFSFHMLAFLLKIQSSLLSKHV